MSGEQQSSGASAPGPQRVLDRAGFFQEHGSWWREVSGRGPVYRLPAQIIATLAGGRAVLTPSEAAAERAFAHLCETAGYGIVGVWDACLVRYPPLAPPAPDLDLAAMGAAVGWSPEQIASGQRALRSTAARREHFRQQQLAYAGWLTCNEQYQQEKRAFQARCEQLSVCLPFPICASSLDGAPTPVAPGEVPEACRLPGDAAAFLEDLAGFLRRWSLMYLASWDLPVSQGPLEEIPASVARELLGADAPVRHDPAYLAIPSSVDVARTIARGQRQRGHEAGIAARFPLAELTRRGDLPSEWESAFRCWIVEQAARQRYGQRRGLSTRLGTGMAVMLECSSDRVRQIRRLYRSALSHPGPA